MILAEKIMKLRKAQGWSQEELAVRLGVSRQSVSKWESMASMPDLDKILKMSELFGVSTDYLLKDNAAEEEGCAAPLLPEEGPVPRPISPEEGPAPRPISLEEANFYLELSERCHKFIALAVALFILSPVPLIAITGMGEYGRIALSEDVAAAVGLLLLFVIVAAGVAILLPSGIKLERYEFLEKEPIAPEYGVAGIVETKREAFAPIYHKGLVVGIVLCILSVVPLFFCMALEAELACVFAVCLLLALIAVGVYIIVRVACPWESYEKLLEEGDYSREHKAENRRNDPFTGFYWCLITAIYLGSSFYTGHWARTWIIWPVAAVLFAALLALRRMLRPER